MSSEIATPQEVVGAAEYAFTARPDSQIKKYTRIRDAKDFSSLPDKSKEPQSNFTWPEVSRYDGEDGRRLYIVVDCAVYDITDFGDLHPAGPEVLKKHAGQDATAAMRATNMPSIVYSHYINRFQVGYIVDPNSENRTCQPKEDLKNE
ncbi:uncharacterized protein LOC128200455 isoform X2 [Galleria mellonella]|uniref:Uncharacterized protein LOC128200455 isoform X2 n=1 Tax=Galleria mellonella TaxID=7137 RepID=A0ABM3MF24_GALME|nr:uncharacterized protein LOC128200455 isoform X2 [Galleria mellonella]